MCPGARLTASMSRVHIPGIESSVMDTPAIIRAMKFSLLQLHQTSERVRCYKEQLVYVSTQLRVSNTLREYDSHLIQELTKDLSESRLREVEASNKALDAAAELEILQKEMTIMKEQAFQLHQQLEALNLCNTSRDMAADKEVDRIIMRNYTTCSSPTTRPATTGQQFAEWTMHRFVKEFAELGLVESGVGEMEEEEEVKTAPPFTKAIYAADMHKSRPTTSEASKNMRRHKSMFTDLVNARGNEESMNSLNPIQIRPRTSGSTPSRRGRPRALPYLNLT